MRRLDFSLPRWSELVWASPELREHWAPVFAAAPLALVNRWIDAVAVGDLPIVAAAAKPFQIPLLMRRARTLGCSVKLLGDLPSDVELPVIGHEPETPILVIGSDAKIQDLADALAQNDRPGLLAAAGWPSCCAKAAIDGGFTDPTWNFVLASHAAGPDAAGHDATDRVYWHPLLARLGIAALPHMPCSPGCTVSAERAARLRCDEALDQLLDWPIAWSGLHGIAEILLPVCKLVHDTDASADKHQVTLASDRLPANTPQGVVPPYRQPKRRPLHETRSFQSGMVRPKENSLPPVGGIIPVDAAALVEPPDVPAVLEGLSKDWMALHRWTLDFLESRFGDREIVLTRGSARKSGDLRTYLAGLRAGRSGGWYLIDFGFEQQCPEMLADFALPPVLDSWHFDLPDEDRPGLRSLYIGGPGSGVDVHVDILGTSAYNILITGAKQWYFCPPSTPDAWLSQEPDLFDPAVRDSLRLKGIRISGYVQQTGETLFVPSGWWHQTRVLETSISLTGNIVNASNADQVRDAIAAATHPLLAEIGRNLLDVIEARQLA